VYKSINEREGEMVERSRYWRATPADYGSSTPSLGSKTHIHIFPSGNTINFIFPENKVTQTRSLYDLGRDNTDQITPTLDVSHYVMLKGCLTGPHRDQCLFPSPALLGMSALSGPMAGIPEPLSRRHNSDYTCNPARSQAPS
jgi:hypothetical protein